MAKVKVKVEPTDEGQGQHAHGHGDNHDHGHHDHGFQAKQLGPDPSSVPPPPSIFTRVAHNLLHQSRKAYVHTRYSNLGNTVALEYQDTMGMISDRYHGQYTYVGQFVLAFVTLVFECRDAILEVVWGFNDFLVLLVVFLLDQILASTWAMFRRLPLRSLVVYSSLVFGTRFFYAVFESQPWPQAAAACLVYSAWATFVGISYLDRPGNWNLACWPKTPRAVVRAVPTWYKSPVFWNMAGILATVGAQYTGVTEPLFPDLIES
ncbi:hypothetical protein PG988_000384 [Apiospora saccharicola]